MATDLAEVDVWNMTLDLLREAPVSAITDTTAVARWFQRNFDISRQAALRAYPWNFALDRAAIAVDPTAPAFGWNYRYQIPTGCLRILPLNINGDWEGTPIAYELEGQYILTNATAPLYVRYIKDIDNPGQWDALFAEALAARMAMKMAHWLTGKASYVQVAEQIYKMALSEAKTVDGMEGTFERPYQDDVIAVRG